jgi:regulator of CtrA degradation
MSEKSGVSQDGQAVMLSFHDRFSTSPQFMKLFREGMSLVEETAEYLDREGRAEARKLTPPISLAYTAESMKLTTRLMQLASWLLLKRAVASGEISAEEAANHKKRVRLVPQSQVKCEGFDDLPARFRQLVEQSHRLHDRIIRLDRLMSGNLAEEEQPAAPVDQQIARIRLAFPAA